MKFAPEFLEVNKISSPPVWGAWIEICSRRRHRRADLVAPRMGGVD